MSIRIAVFADDLWISQIPVMCRYLGQEFKMAPEDMADQIHAEEILYSCHQCFVDGRSCNRILGGDCLWNQFVVFNLKCIKNYNV